MSFARAWSLACLVVLLVPVGGATHKGDPHGDQAASAPYDRFEGSRLECVDDAMDLTGTWSSVDPSSVTLGVSVPVMNATTASCGAPYVPAYRVGHLDGSLGATAGSGHAVSIVFGVRGETACVRLTDVASGASGCVAFTRYLVGNFFEWEVARSGTFTDASGTSHAYALDGPVSFVVETWSVGGSVGDVALPTLYDRATY